MDNRQVRTIEMIPRQSSFNVNDVKVRNRSGALNVIASFLIGLGANLNYQRQRERYSQFVQQELYAAAFGKGSREFGWTFTSMPGTDRLVSGLRTTYAIVIVPEEATSILLQSTGCGFDRKAAQPENFAKAVGNDWSSKQRNRCSDQKNFVVTIPGGGPGGVNNFSVDELSFKPVKKGKRIIVTIRGSNFPPQIGILINGVSLPASIGLAQDFIRDDSDVGSKVRKEMAKQTVRGGFERVNSNQLVVAFEMAKPENGTPTITLITPSRATDINHFPLEINGRPNISLNNSIWMFGVKPASTFKIKDVQVFKTTIGTGANKKVKLNALITGDFTIVSKVFVNGKDETAKSSLSALNNVLHIKEFDPPDENKIHIVIIHGVDTIKLNPMANPAKAKPPAAAATLDKTFNVKLGQVIAYFSTAKKEKLKTLLVEIRGDKLSKKVTTSIGQYDFVGKKGPKGKEVNTGYITISEPKPAQTIRITNLKENKFTEIVVALPDVTKEVVPPMPKPTAKPVSNE